MTDQIQSMTLAQRLRAETAQAHLSLEESLGFDIHHPNADVAIAMLENFYRVLQVFEPTMVRFLPERLRNRVRLALLADNLETLARNPSAIEPVDHIWLPTRPAEAMGALYVLEGSTLGGKVISKALRRVEDWPLRGKSYFDPYEGDTGAMWAAFLVELAAIDPDESDAVVFGANQTFNMLQGVMTQEELA